MNKHARELSEAEEQEHLILDAIDKWLDRDVRPYVLEFDHGDKYPYDMVCLLYTSPSPRDLSTSRMPSSA